MGLFDLIRKKPDNTENKDLTKKTGDSLPKDLLTSSEQLLMEVSTDLSVRDSVRLPISEIATLGGAFSSLLPSLRTITQTASTSGGGLYQLANASIGDVLKASKDGSFWGALKTNAGGSKMAKFVEAGPVNTVTKTVAPINPAMLAMAATLANIEKKLSEIADLEKQILTILKNEKESEIEGDLTPLTRMIKEYKFNWDNELYCKNNHMQVLNIKRSAEQNIILYQKEIASVVKSNPGFLFGNSAVGEKQQALQKNFQYYKLSLYIFSFASMMEVMFSGNFREEYIEQIVNTIEDYSIKYRKYYGECYGRIQQLSSGAIESVVAQGLGDACNAIGGLFGGKGAIGEWFVDRGNDLKDASAKMGACTLEKFTQIKDPGIALFVENLNQTKRLYSNNSEVYFDRDSVYIVGSVA